MVPVLAIIYGPPLYSVGLLFGIQIKTVVQRDDHGQPKDRIISVDFLEDNNVNSLIKTFKKMI
jgi:hypothetical protein